MFDPETVLLVDHDDPEAVELDTLLNQSVRTDGDVDRAVGKARQHLATICAGHTAGEQLHPQRAVAEKVGGVGNGDPVEQPSDSGRVLFRKDFGGRHQCTLVATLHRAEHRAHGDERLARSDVALQQAVHRVRAGEVAFDLLDRSLLSTRQLIWQRRPESPDELAIHSVADALGVALHRQLAHHQNRLHAKQFIEREPTTGGFLLRVGLWQVDAFQRLVPGDEAQPSQRLVRKRIRDTACFAACQRLLDRAQDHPARQVDLLALGVDRDDRPWALVGRTEHVHGRRRHLLHALEAAHLAEHRDPRARLQLPLAPRLIEEHERHSTCAVTDRCHHATRRAAAARRGVHRADLPHHQRIRSLGSRLHGRLLGAIDPAAGVVRQQLVQVLDPKLAEGLQTLAGSHRLESLDTDRGKLGDGESRHSEPKR